MFGYVIPSLDVLPAAEQARFKAAYCGLCNTLAQHNGQQCRTTLSYDLVFMALVLGSLYELPEQEGQTRCPMHPTKRMGYVTNTAYPYVADLSVALAYHKLADDWADDHSAKARAAMVGIAGAYKKASTHLLAQCGAIEAAMARIRALEQAGETNADAAANCFGMLLGTLFAWAPSEGRAHVFWKDALRLFGARLGKFVYVMDAAMDLQDDAKTGSYNPFVQAGVVFESTREPLEMLAAAVADAFERLPIERDVHLLRSVVYEGMWARYNAKAQGAEDAGQDAADSECGTADPEPGAAVPTGGNTNVGRTNESAKGMKGGGA